MAASLLHEGAEVDVDDEAEVGRRKADVEEKKEETKAKANKTERISYLFCRRCCWFSNDFKIDIILYYYFVYFYFLMLPYSQDLTVFSPTLKEMVTEIYTFSLM